MFENSQNSENRRIHFNELNKDMPLKDKIFWAKKKIKEFFIWAEENKYEEITVSFSGGKDSTILFHLVNEVHKEIKSEIYLIPAYAVEITFPSTLKFIKDTCEKYQEENEYIKELLIKPPKMPWNQILDEKGYPIFSKQTSVLFNRIKNSKTKSGLTNWIFNIESTIYFKLNKERLFLLDDEMLKFPEIPVEYQDYFPKNTLSGSYTFSEKCCTYVKGGLKKDNRPSFIGTMADESAMRKKSWVDNGCNVFNNKKPMSRPLSIWNEKDVWKYIKQEKLEINEAYNFDHNLDWDKQDLRFKRLGCISCPFGSAVENRKIQVLKKSKKEVSRYELMNRYEKLYDYLPKLYKFHIINTGMYKVIIDMGIKIECDDKYQALYDIRWNQISEWYKEENFRTNLLRVMCQIENHNNYKKWDRYKAWEYTLEDFNKALNNYKIVDQTNKTEINKIRSMIKKEYDKNNPYPFV